MWLGNLRLVLPDQVVARGAVRIEGGTVAAIAEGEAPGPAIDGRGLTLIPGLVDLHGDMIEKEVEPRPGAPFPLPVAVAELDRRLAASGVTTAYAGVSFAETRDRGHLRSEEKARGIVEAVMAARDGLLVDLRVHARFEVTNARAEPVLRELVGRELVHLVSLTDHTPGQGQYRQLEHYVSYYVRAHGHDAAAVEAEARARMAAREATPLAWEVAQGVTGLARERGIPIASHDDDTPEKVRVMQALGATISEFPVTVAAAAEARHLGLATLMGAPNALRGGSMTGNISALTLAEAGLLDALAADYHQGAMLPAVFAYARTGVMPLPEAIALVTRNPARAVGLEDRGAVAEGQRADLALVEDRGDAPPRIRATLRAGVPVYSDGTLRLDGLVA
ncbi:alpha-D-ribose 1-methylphosphonate 5-triphosphate diphosphatase [Roseomonas sp. OT10]|uniref:alpha-D-ribose 1-methylphosphonate 5-triphosphate diphosphatase n=1 Tax=Roseomonas cutis TaxID=2897332 RepID=UPI001E5ED6D6|nr:alpha-D-ribose 1-methylphosphonate 5-triphosphate diphosphatase [Roseomonas sp. OT10]UFN48800.1 alpha-D-ribose 1-methylphosphonate 5-triphosphate diphosphatase [Roseomonas sp. OT10]